MKIPSIGTIRREGRGWVAKQEFASALNLTNKGFLVVSLLLLTCCGGVRPSIRPPEAGYSGTGRCTSSKFPVPNSQLIHVTILIIRGACHGSVPRNDTPFVIYTLAPAFTLGTKCTPKIFPPFRVVKTTIYF